MNNPPKYIRHSMSFIAFSNNLVHQHVASKVFGEDRLIHGAGFLKFLVDDSFVKVECFGESISLDVEPRWDDAEKIISPLGIMSSEKPVRAKYLLTASNVVIFSESLDANAIADSVFGNSSFVKSAGFISFSVMDGKIYISCTGALSDFNTPSHVSDSIFIAENFGITI